MFGDLLKKYRDTQPKIALVQAETTKLPAAQNDDDFDVIEVIIPTEQALNPQAQFRRDKVIAMLKADPSIKRALIDDHESDPLNVILTVAIRDVGTVELLLPKKTYDGMAVLMLLDNLQTTH